MLNNKQNDILKTLELGIKEVFESKNYKQYLAVMSKFHNYSFRNSLLIMMQKPEATLVKGYVSWKDLNRHVNKGEKGIQILAPCPVKERARVEEIDPVTLSPKLDNNGNPLYKEIDVIKPVFKPVTVFDISQTSGEPLPKLAKELTGDVDNYKEFFESLKKVSPFPIFFESLKDNIKGYCDPVNLKIVINDGMSEKQRIKTAIHEITHADLHTGETLSLDYKESKDRRTKEVEAESVAYIVCNHYGIDTSEYSFPYLAGWSGNKDLSELKNSLDTIQKQSGDLIDRIDNHYSELILNAEQANNVLKLKDVKSTSLLDRLNSAKKVAIERTLQQQQDKEKNIDVHRGEER